MAKVMILPVFVAAAAIFHVSVAFAPSHDMVRPLGFMNPSVNCAHHIHMTSTDIGESASNYPSPEHGANNIIEETRVGVTASSDVGEFSPDEKLGLQREKANVGDPQVAQLEQPMNITKVLTELQAIQSQGPKKYCILGTRHCSFLHQQIVEML